MLKQKKVAIISSLIILISSVYFGERLINVQVAAQSSLPVFPGAEGFGTDTVAGRGGRVIRVTNLNDTGFGSLRDCVDQSGPRVCVFDVAGRIDIKSRYGIRNPYLTIAGQTAPSPGITVSGETVRVTAKDVLIQHIRFRTGDEGYKAAPDDLDGISGLGGNSGNVVFDHISVSWAVDENVDYYNANTGSTISYSIVSEALDDSLHSKGRHSKGIRMGKGSGAPVVISAHHNLFAHNVARNAQIAFYSEVEFINNLIYNWGYAATKIVADASADVISNYYKAGGASTATEIICNGAFDDAEIYASGNVGPNRSSSSSGDDWDSLVASSCDKIKSSSRVLASSGIIIDTAEQVYEKVLNNAGARPADRDSIDTRIVKDVREGTGSIIDSQNDVGGYDSAAGVILATRTITIPSDHATIRASGYSVLEEDILFPMAAEVEGIVSGVCGDGTLNIGEQCDDGNTVSGDGCSSACQLESTDEPADLDKDGDVDIFDYNLLVENFGNTSCGNIADIDGNCKVDIFDYNILVENFGR